MKTKMKLHFLLILYITFNMSSADSLPDDIGKKVFSSAANIEENQCYSYTFTTLKPLLDNFQEIQNKLRNHDNIIEIKDREIRELKVLVNKEKNKKKKKVKVYKKLADTLRENNRLLTETCKSAKQESDQFTELNRTIAAYAETINERNSQIIKFKAQIDSDNAELHKCEDELRTRLDLLIEKDEIIIKQESQLENITIITNKTQVELEECKKPNLEGLVDSCKPFETSPGIHKIKIADMDPFDVLCASSATGAGWIVIQQRIDGKEDFYRDWNTYKAGFGSFSGDFFLGLEKIHQLTRNQRHELYIHLERFNGIVTYATYDHFAIAGEDDQYGLINVDGFSGNTTDSYDHMYHSQNQKFYTFDRDNEPGCAKELHAGYWFDYCATSNLNGKYFKSEVSDQTGITWYGFTSLKKVQMLIRPKFD